MIKNRLPLLCLLLVWPHFSQATQKFYSHNFHSVLPQFLLARYGCTLCGDIPKNTPLVCSEDGCNVGICPQCWRPTITYGTPLDGCLHNGAKPRFHKGTHRRIAGENPSKTSTDVWHKLLRNYLPKSYYDKHEHASTDQPKPVLLSKPRPSSWGTRHSQQPVIAVKTDFAETLNEKLQALSLENSASESKPEPELQQETEPEQTKTTEDSNEDMLDDELAIPGLPQQIFPIYQQAIPRNTMEYQQAIDTNLAGLKEELLYAHPFLDEKMRLHQDKAIIEIESQLKDFSEAKVDLYTRRKKSEQLYLQSSHNLRFLKEQRLAYQLKIEPEIPLGVGDLVVFDSKSRYGSMVIRVSSRGEQIPMGHVAMVVANPHNSHDPDQIELVTAEGNGACVRTLTGIMENYQEEYASAWIVRLDRNHDAFDAAAIYSKAQELTELTKEYNLLGVLAGLAKLTFKIDITPTSSKDENTRVFCSQAVAWVLRESGLLYADTKSHEVATSFLPYLKSLNGEHLFSEQAWHISLYFKEYYPEYEGKVGACSRAGSPGRVERRTQLATSRSQTYEDSLKRKHRHSKELPSSRRHSLVDTLGTLRSRARRRSVDLEAVESIPAPPIFARQTSEPVTATQRSLSQQSSGNSLMNAKTAHSKY